MAKRKPLNRKRDRASARAELEAAAAAEGVFIERRQATVDRYLDTFEIYAENLALLRDEGLSILGPDEGPNQRVATHSTLSRLLERQRIELGLSPAGAKRPALDEAAAEVPSEEMPRAVEYTFNNNEAS